MNRLFCWIETMVTSTVQNHWNKRVDNTIAQIEIECIQNSKNERQKDVQRKAEFKQLVIFRFQFRVHYIDMTLKILVSLNIYIYLISKRLHLQNKTLS